MTQAPTRQGDGDVHSTQVSSQGSTARGAHTPGPWWPTDSGVRNSGGYIAHTNSVQRYEGQDERYAREVAERKADKRLIAAAPELLEAALAAKHILEIAATRQDGVQCVYLTSRAGSMLAALPTIRQLDAAIAKATKEPA